MQLATKLVDTLCPKGPLWRLPTYAGENKAFPPSPPPSNVVRRFKLPVENKKKHPNFEWRGEGGRGLDCFVLLSYPFFSEHNASIIMSPIVAPRVIFWQNLQKRTGQLRLVTEILSVNLLRRHYWCQFSIILELSSLAPWPERKKFYQNMESNENYRYVIVSNMEHSK